MGCRRGEPPRSCGNRYREADREVGKVAQAWCCHEPAGKQLPRFRSDAPSRNSNFRQDSDEKQQQRQEVEVFVSVCRQVIDSLGCVVVIGGLAALLLHTLPPSSCFLRGTLIQRGL